MQVKKKTTAWFLVVAYGCWEIIVQPIWNLNLERVAERNSIDGALAEFAPMTWAANVLGYLPQSFPAGFVLGALVFAYWDNIRGLWLKYRGKLPPPDTRVWTGNMVPYFDRKTREFSLMIYVVNLGDLEYVTVATGGSIKLTTAEGRFNLDAVEEVKGLDGILGNGFTATIVVKFDTPAKMWGSYPDMFIWSNPKTHLDFSDLSISLRTLDGYEKELILWNSMRLTAGEEEVCAVQTFPIFKSEEDRLAFQKALGTVARRFENL